MTRRSLGAQCYHDRVIIELTAVLAEMNGGATIHCNPGNEQRFGVGGLFPDIVLCHKEDQDQSIRAFEVETMHSLNKWNSWAWSDWLDLGHSLTVVVPEILAGATRTMLMELGLTTVEVMTYGQVSDGRITFGACEKVVPPC